MDDFGEGELFNIRNQFYTHQHVKVGEYSVNLFSPDSQLKVFEFKVRSLIALGKDASTLIDEGKVQFPENDELFHLLSAWNDLKSFGTDDSTYFQDLKAPTFELQAILSTIYLVRFEKDIEQAIQQLTTYIKGLSGFQKFNELEPYLVLIQLHLAKGNFTAANNIFLTFDEFPDNIKDNIIYQIIESWLNSIKGESDNINNALFFYDELLNTGFSDDADKQGKFKALSLMFALEIKLHHYPEAQEKVNEIEALGVNPDADYTANKITLDYLTNYGDNVAKLTKELEALDEAHPFLVELKEKNAKFDDIVQKYSATS